MITTIIISTDDLVSPLTNTMEEIKASITLLISTDFLASIDRYVKKGEKIPKNALNVHLDGKNYDTTIYRVDADLAANLIMLAHDARDNGDYIKIVAYSHSGKKITTIFN